MNPNPRILYVDDDPALRRLVQRALSRRGFTVDLADGADAGLAMLREGAFDLVAIDHYMPGVDGLSLLNQILALPAAPPVVYVTGSEETQIAVTALKSGAADFVVKSVGEHFFDLLASAFEQALDRVALQRAAANAESELREANARLEALLGEVHHRVANSLQMVAGFVSMQARLTEDPAARSALAETLARIQAVSQVHSRLYTSANSEVVDLDAYLQTLIDAMRESLANLPGGVELKLAAEPVTVKPDVAVSVGVIVTELVTNAAKYAFDGDHSGSIDVALQAASSGFTVEVRDDGKGFAATGEAQGTGLGMRIIQAMARSLRSQVEQVETARGSCLRLAVHNAQ